METSSIYLWHRRLARGRKKMNSLYLTVRCSRTGRRAILIIRTRAVYNKVRALVLSYTLGFWHVLGGNICGHKRNCECFYLFMCYGTAITKCPLLWFCVCLSIIKGDDHLDKRNMLWYVYHCQFQYKYIGLYLSSTLSLTQSISIYLSIYLSQPVHIY